MNVLEEYKGLRKKFPFKDKVEIGTENCDWCDHVFDSKNCYYAFDSTEMNECLYSYDDYKGSGNIDTLWNAFCERCIEVSDSGETSDSAYCQYLGQCYNMYYSFNCGSCHDCFGCYNLGNKEFCIFNVQHTEEEYRAKLPELLKMDPEEVVKKVKEEVESKFPKIQSFFRDNNNSDYVDYVYKSNSAYYCFDGTALDECFYVNNSNECSLLLDASYCHKVENSIEAVDSSECYNCYQIQECDRCFDSCFLYNCKDTSNCAFCVNLENKQHCILNVQYSKEEYASKLAEIKKELGLLFPQS